MPQGVYPLIFRDSITASFPEALHDGLSRVASATPSGLLAVVSLLLRSPGVVVCASQDSLVEVSAYRPEKSLLFPSRRLEA